MQNFNTIPPYYAPSRETPRKEQKKRICLWCYNGCKNKKVYTSHYMKNYRGEITCPKLLKTICRNCGKSGHAMGRFCLEAQKPRDELLPAPSGRKFFVDRRTCDSYYPGDSDYFPLSSDDESSDDESKDEKNATKLKEIAGKYHPEIKSIVTTNTNPKMMEAMQTFLRPKEPVKVAVPIVVPITWASKLFAKPNDA